MHFFQDKETLRLSRERKAPLKYEDKTVFLFPDYSADVQEQRRGYKDIIKSLKEMKVKYSLRFPARLCVEHDGETLSYSTPEKAKSFVTQLEEKARNGD